MDTLKRALTPDSDNGEEDSPCYYQVCVPSCGELLRLVPRSPGESTTAQQWFDVSMDDAEMIVLTCGMGSPISSKWKQILMSYVKWTPCPLPLGNGKYIMYRITVDPIELRVFGSLRLMFEEMNRLMVVVD